MPRWLIAVLLLLTPCITKAQTAGCYPDKGIRLAKTTTSLNGERQEGMQEISFDREGRPMKKENATEGDQSITTYHYEEGKLRYTMIESEVPSWMGDGETTTQLDTSRVDAYDEEGRPLEIGGVNGLRLLFSYEGCEQEVQTYLQPNGDTLQQYVMRVEDGVLVQTVWTPHLPIKSSQTSTYYDYQFNRKGHWIKRSYRHEGKGEVVEKRKLTYY